MTWKKDAAGERRTLRGILLIYIWRSVPLEELRPQFGPARVSICPTPLSCRHEPDFPSTYRIRHFRLRDPRKDQTVRLRLRLHTCGLQYRLCRCCQSPCPPIARCCSIHGRMRGRSFINTFSTMPKKATLSPPACFFHVVARGIEGRDIFSTREDRQRFLSLLSTGLNRTGFVCYA